MSDEQVVCKLNGKVHIYPLTYRALVQLEQKTGRSLTEIFEDIRMADVYLVVYLVLRNNRAISRWYRFNKFMRDVEHISVERVNFSKITVDDFLNSMMGHEDDGEEDD